VAGECLAWLNSREEKKKAAMSVPKDIPFVTTPSAELFLNTLRFAQVMPEIVVIAGGAGIGKTSAAEHYCSSGSDVWLATMQPCTKSPYSMLSAIAEEMDVTGNTRSRIVPAIGRRVADRDCLLIIDEAQHLDAAAVDQLRALHDIYQLGIALIGDTSMYSKLEAEGKAERQAQIFSRIGHRITQSEPTTSDIRMLLKGWSVSEEDEQQFLNSIAERPGSLRVLTKTIKLATMQAAADGQERALKHFRTAWQTISSTTDIPASGGKNA
jgi:DNA transposition AAA+ family ATPase